MLLKVLTTLLLTSPLILQFGHGFPLKADEDVIFFPTSAQQQANNNCQIPIHAWVFEDEKKSLMRKMSIKLIGEIMESVGISEEQTESKLFHDRLGWFLVDNQRNKQLEVLINSHTYALSKTKANGHSYTNITTSCNSDKDSWITFKVKMTPDDNRQFLSEVQLIPKRGLSVISDIDDTIKISEVLDKKKLIRNTFAEPFLASPGMPEFYRHLNEKGAYFHYVSASPWQLYPSLKRFMKNHYPKGTISLRKFRVKDSSLIDFFKPSSDYKLTKIRDIIERYPKHQFILIGDNGEHDPEVYNIIAKEFPNNIQAVYIRDVLDSTLDKTRRIQEGGNTRLVTWKTFKDPAEFH